MNPDRPPARFAHLAPYDGEIAFCDEQIGRLLGELARQGRDERLVTIVTADHGEALGEHGEPTHGVFVYEATMRVPLLIRAPGLAAGTVAEPVSTVDIPLTVLQLLGIPATELPEASTRSLLERGERGLLVESLLPYHSHRWRPLRGLVSGAHKYIEAGELYDLDADPDELHELSASDPGRTAQLREALSRLLGAHPPLRRTSAASLSPEDEQRLAALGYAGSPGGAEDPFSLPLPDARDRIHDLRLRDQAFQLLRQGREQNDSRALDEARAILEQWRANHPLDPMAVAQLGLVELSARRWQQAAALFEEHARSEPRSAVTHFNLAQCYWAMGRTDDALEQAGMAVRCEPRFAGAYIWLADRAVELQDYGRATWWLLQLLNAGALSEAERAGLQPKIDAIMLEMRARGQRPSPP